MNSCRDCSTCKEPARDFRVRIRSVDGLCGSLLRRHIAELETGSELPLRVSQLRQLRSLPRLTSLFTTLDGADLLSGRAAAYSSELRVQLMRDVLPLQLRKLHLSLSRPRRA
jgi:hypothetical protein